MHRNIIDVCKYIFSLQQFHAMPYAQRNKEEEKNKTTKLLRLLMRLTIHKSRYQFHFFPYFKGGFYEEIMRRSGTGMHRQWSPCQ